MLNSSSFTPSSLIFNFNYSFLDKVRLLRTRKHPVRPLEIMEAFVSAIKAQQFALSAWDMSASHTNIPYIYYFKNPNSGSADDFMPSSRLRASFLKALEEFPILVGHITVGKDGRYVINVNPHNLNMPEYLESQSTVHFHDLEKAKFSWDALPQNVATVGAFLAVGVSGIIKLVNVNIIRLAENSGLVLFVSIPHYAVDGVGYCAFVNRWAELCRWMQHHATGNEPPRHDYNFERSTISRYMPDNRAPLNSTMSMIFDSPSYFGDFIAWISPETRGNALVNFGRMLNATGHMFHISAASLGTLRAFISKCASQTQIITDNDMLTVLISHVISKGMRDEAKNSQGFRRLVSTVRSTAQTFKGGPEEFLTMMVLDARSRINGLMQSQYAGNCVTCITLVTKLDQLAKDNITSSDLAELCAQTRSLVKSATPEFIAELDYVHNKSAAAFGHAIAKGITIQNKVNVSNQSRFPLYQNDFGSGIPEWVSPIPVFYANFGSILPVHPSANGGYNIYLTIGKRVMARILQNKLWNSHVNLVY